MSQRMRVVFVRLRPNQVAVVTFSRRRRCSSTSRRSSSSTSRPRPPRPPGR